jgi:hypothetical protein
VGRYARSRGWRCSKLKQIVVQPRRRTYRSCVDWLPNGFLSVNDDYRHRVVIIGPATKQIIWQHGVTDSPGTAPNQLNVPDGFDLLAPDNTTPTHPKPDKARVGHRWRISWASARVPWLPTAFTR